MVVQDSLAIEKILVAVQDSLATEKILVAVQDSLAIEKILVVVQDSLAIEEILHDHHIREMMLLKEISPIKIHKLEANHIRSSMK